MGHTAGPTGSAWCHGGGVKQNCRVLNRERKSPQKPFGLGYLLVAAPTGCLVGRELLLHVGSLVHLLGVEGQAAQGAEWGRHLQTWLEALPTEPAGGRGHGPEAAGRPAAVHTGQLPAAVNSTFLDMVTSAPESHWLDGYRLAKRSPFLAMGSWGPLPYPGARRSYIGGSLGPVLASQPWSQQEL